MKAKRVRKLDPKGPLVENAARIVRVRLDEMRSFVPAALRPECASEQHDLRIAAKRLRYVLEATASASATRRMSLAVALATSRACSATCTTAT